MSEPKVYTCNCRTPLYQAAPDMYEFIEWLRTVEGQCVILKAKKYMPQILDKVDEILKKARGEV